VRNIYAVYLHNGHQRDKTGDKLHQIKVGQHINRGKLRNKHVGAANHLYIDMRHGHAVYVVGKGIAEQQMGNAVIRFKIKIQEGVIQPEGGIIGRGQCRHLAQTKPGGKIFKNKHVKVCGIRFAPLYGGGQHHVQRVHAHGLEKGQPLGVMGYGYLKGLAAALNQSEIDDMLRMERRDKTVQ
jgi:hypothetical protein